jgi:hypothetical protein
MHTHTQAAGPFFLSFLVGAQISLLQNIIGAIIDGFLQSLQICHLSHMYPFMHTHTHTHTHKSTALQAWIWVRNQLEKFLSHTHSSRVFQAWIWVMNQLEKLLSHTHTSRAFQAWIWVRTQLEKFLSVVGKACGWGPFENKGTTHKQSISSMHIGEEPACGIHFSGR